MLTDKPAAVEAYLGFGLFGERFFPEHELNGFTVFLITGSVTKPDLGACGPAIASRYPMTTDVCTKRCCLFRGRSSSREVKLQAGHRCW